ncbi:MAG: hypothetical protein VX699_09785 [Myxococcota bacterium]|nr:hypothetical protein [Myxococcota bacterium]
MSQLSVLGTPIPAEIQSPKAIAKHLSKTGAIPKEHRSHLSKAIAERFKLKENDTIDRNRHCFFSANDFNAYTRERGITLPQAGLQAPTSPGALSSKLMTEKQSNEIQALSAEMAALMERLSPKKETGPKPPKARAWREPRTSAGPVATTRVAIETEMASVSLDKPAHAHSLIAAINDPEQPEITNWTLIQSAETTTITDEQTGDEVTLPLFTVELESGQGADAYFIEISTGPIPYGNEGAGLKVNQSILDCWLRACEEIGGSNGAKASLQNLTEAFNRIATTAKLPIHLDLTPGGEFLQKKGEATFSVRRADHIRLSLPSQANVQIPLGNVGKKDFLTLFNKADARSSFSRCQQEAARFVSEQLPDHGQTDNMRSLFSLYLFHLTRLHSICQANDKKHQKGLPLDNEKDILNCLCKAPINDLIRMGLTSVEKSALFDTACEPGHEEDTFVLIPEFNTALNHAIGQAGGAGNTEAYTQARNQSMYFAHNPNEIFLPSTRYVNMGNQPENQLYTYGDQVSSSNRELLKEEKWGRRSAWKPEYPLVMTDNFVEPVLTDRTAVAVWEQRSRNSPLTTALLPQNTGETTGSPSPALPTMLRQISHRE